MKGNEALYREICSVVAIDFMCVYTHILMYVCVYILSVKVLLAFTEIPSLLPDNSPGKKTDMTGYRGVAQDPVSGVGPFKFATVR